MGKNLLLAVFPWRKSVKSPSKLSYNVTRHALACLIVYTQRVHSHILETSRQNQDIKKVHGVISLYGNVTRVVYSSVVMVLMGRNMDSKKLIPQIYTIPEKNWDVGLLFLVLIFCEVTQGSVLKGEWNCGEL